VKFYLLSHLSHADFGASLVASFTNANTAIAVQVAHIAEAETRQWHLAEGYPSMFRFVVSVFHLTEEAAYKRIHAARAARRHPAIFEALAEGRLHLSAVIMLAPHLTDATADELIAAATHRTKSEIEQLLAVRFPRPDVPASVRATAPIALALSSDQHAPGRVESSQVVANRGSNGHEHAPGRVARRSRVTPLSAESFAVQFTWSRRAHEKLQHAHALLGHQLRSGDVAGVFERALDALIERLEQRKIAATAKPRAGRRAASTNPRHIPAQVKRAVWERDGGRCSFVSESGHRCEARDRLEFDHVLEVARGGTATVEGIRLLCRAHNQYAAERTFGPEFMREKRRAAAEARRAEQARREVELQDAAEARRAEQSRMEEVIPWLRSLGIGAAATQRAAEAIGPMPGATLEQRVRTALSFHGAATVAGVRAVARLAATPPQAAIATASHA